jgi:hypothetical protein
VIGELLHPPFNVKVKQNAEIKGTSFEDTVDIVYESSGRNRKVSATVAVDVLTNLTKKDVLQVAGKFLNIVGEIGNYLVLVVEDGCSRESYSHLDRLLNRMREEIGPNEAIFVEKKAPLKGIKEALDSAATALEAADMVKSVVRQKSAE